MGEPVTTAHKVLTTAEILVRDGPQVVVTGDFADVMKYASKIESALLECGAEYEVSRKIGWE